MTSELTQLLAGVEQGDPSAAAKLLPLVYDELRQLAEQKLRREKPGHTLQPTALVHEAYLRLVGSDAEAPAAKAGWKSRGHFFGAAAQAMRRILVDNARRRARHKRGGDRKRVPVAEVEVVAPELPDDMVALDEALDRLATADKQAAELVHLRFFAGLPLPEIARLMDISPRTADRLWAYARAWLHREIRGDPDPENASPADNS